MKAHRQSFLLAAVIFLLAVPPARPDGIAASSPETPLLTVGEDCPAMAWSPDGSRVAYAVKRVIHWRDWDKQRDDIGWVDLRGKRKRILDGQKMVPDHAEFSYSIRSLAWSPDGRALLAEMLTSDDKTLTMLVTDEGKEVRIGDKGDNIVQGFSAAWLGDNETVAFLIEAVKPRLLFKIAGVRIRGGRGLDFFPTKSFAAVAWDEKQRLAVAVQREKDFQGSPKLVLLRLDRESSLELAELADGFLGSLRISPSGKLAGYFVDQGTFEIRDLAAPQTARRVKIPFGRYVWAPDEQRILLQLPEGPPRRAGGRLVWVDLRDGKTTPLLHSVVVRDFALSPNGRYLAITHNREVRSLAIYSLP